MELVTLAAGVHACLQPDRGLGWSNSGLVDRGDGLMVDTFWDLPRTRALLGRYAEVRRDPPGRLVNTHHNGDHCWGNQVLAESGAEIIGHHRCADAMRTERLGPERLSALAAGDPASGRRNSLAQAIAQFDFAGIEITPPTTLVGDDGLELDLGGQVVRIVYVGPAHTAGDVIVHLPEDGVVFAGDVLFHRCTPIGWEGTHARWVDALDAIVALEPEVVVPGHGPLADVDDVREARTYLEYVHREARSGYEQGLTPLEAARRIEIGPPYDRWTEPERIVFLVHRCFREFRGESWDASFDTMTAFADVAVLRRELGS